jgi:hypothetical protein
VLIVFIAAVTEMLVIKLITSCSDVMLFAAKWRDGNGDHHVKSSKPGSEGQR